MHAEKGGGRRSMELELGDPEVIDEHLIIRAEQRMERLTFATLEDFENLLINAQGLGCKGEILEIVIERSSESRVELIEQPVIVCPDTGLKILVSLYDIYTA